MFSAQLRAYLLRGLHQHLARQRAHMSDVSCESDARGQRLEVRIDHMVTTTILKRVYRQLGLMVVSYDFRVTNRNTGVNDYLLLIPTCVTGQTNKRNSI